jgi:hypothetical protein
MTQKYCRKVLDDEGLVIHTAYKHAQFFYVFIHYFLDHKIFIDFTPTYLNEIQIIKEATCLQPVWKYVIFVFLQQAALEIRFGIAFFAVLDSCVVYMYR